MARDSPEQVRNALGLSDSRGYALSGGEPTTAKTRVQPMVHIKTHARAQYLTLIDPKYPAAADGFGNSLDYTMSNFRKTLGVDNGRHECKIKLLFAF